MRLRLAERLGCPTLDFLTARPEFLGTISAALASIAPGCPPWAGWHGGTWLNHAGVTELALEVLDRRLGTPDSQRDARELRKLGSPQRQLRALLWKQGVDGYNDPRLNVFELVERLEQKVVQSEGKVTPP